MPSLFDQLEETRSSNWKPLPPPELRTHGVKEIELDCETTGLRWWAGDKPIGLSIRLPNGHTQYVPWGHRGGGNLDEQVVSEWARRELRDIRITNINTKFDIQMLRVWGIDLEAQNCEVADVGHYAALLDDYRIHLSLEAIAEDYLKKGKTGQELDKSRMATYHAGEVAAYACQDVALVGELKQIMWKKMSEEGLHKVRALEDELIYVVCEMERNGARIDVDLLDKWVKETERDLHQTLFQIFRETGLRVNPKSPKDLLKLFNQLKLPVSRTKQGRPSFTGAILSAIEHPTIRLVIKAAKLIQLRTKYLLPYAARVDRSTGILRYALHQLRVEKDPNDDTKAAGTISGRFSSTKIFQDPNHRLPDEGLNIQQIMKPEKQIAQYGNEHIVRELHIPADGWLFLSSDAMQIEYRLFVHETKAKRLIKIFEDDPEASFHRKTHEIFLKSLPKLTYRRMKDTNFAEIYGAGLLKKAFMLEYITKDEFDELNDIRRQNGYSDPRLRDNPKLREVRELNAVYEREIPESKPLLKRTQKIAEERGYINTILGRRSRFPDGNRSYKALNSRIQGSAADIMKQKLVELHKARHVTGFKLRYTVHDEVDGDCPNQESARIVARLLNQQSFKLRVPILWETSTGYNWKKQTDVRHWSPIQYHKDTVYPFGEIAEAA